MARTRRRESQGLNVLSAESREHLERRLQELIEAAEWADLVPRVAVYTRHCLAQYGEAEGRRWQTITHSYVVRTHERLFERGVDCVRWSGWRSLFQFLCAAVKRLVDKDEEKLQGILATTDWADVIPRVIAHTVRRLGSRTSSTGKAPSDYVYDAVLYVFTHRRHYPHYRNDLSLFTFLCKTVHGMRTNDAARNAAEERQREEGRRSFPQERPEPVIHVDDIEAFLASLEPHLREYALLRARETHRTARDYAEALGVSVQTIRNYDRQLKRRRARWTGPI